MSLPLFCSALVAHMDQEFEETLPKVKDRDGAEAWAAFCGGLSLIEQDMDFVPQHEVESLLQESYVTHLDRDPCLVEAEFVAEPRGKARYSPVALTTPPVRLELSISDKHQPGDTVRVAGPHCSFQTTVPDDAQPGDTMLYYLGPLPEFEVTVPPHAKPGSYVNITRDDGSAIRVPVPKDCPPGDSFSVEPPVVMVKVPEGFGEGDDIFFERNDSWLHAKVPGELRPGGYFAARLPPPGCEKAKFVPSLPVDESDEEPEEFFSY